MSFRPGFNARIRFWCEIDRELWRSRIWHPRGFRVPLQHARAVHLRKAVCIHAPPCFFHQCQQFRESPSLARDLGARSGRRRGDQASGLGFGAHLNEDSRGMARAVSTRILIATHLRSGFLRFERAHKTQRERGKSFEAIPSPHPIVRPSSDVHFS